MMSSSNLLSIKIIRHYNYAYISAIYHTNQKQTSHNYIIPESRNGGIVVGHNSLLKPQAGESRGRLVEFPPHDTLWFNIEIFWERKPTQYQDPN